MTCGALAGLTGGALAGCEGAIEVTTGAGYAEGVVLTGAKEDVVIGAPNTEKPWNQCRDETRILRQKKWKITSLSLLHFRPPKKTT